MMAPANGGPGDIGQGRLIPTLSVDQYAATLANWFGVVNSSLATVIPNIGNYTASTLGTNIGFVWILAETGTRASGPSTDSVGKSVRTGDSVGQSG